MEGNKIYVVVQDFNDVYGGGSWQKRYYQSKDDAIKVLEEAIDEGQSCMNDFVVELESFENINDTIDIIYYAENKENDSTVVAYFVDQYDDDEYRLVIKEE